VCGLAFKPSPLPDAKLGLKVGYKVGKRRLELVIEVLGEGARVREGIWDRLEVVPIEINHGGQGISWRLLWEYQVVWTDTVKEKPTSILATPSPII
jgi:hypothetical protein